MKLDATGLAPSIRLEVTVCSPCAVTSRCWSKMRSSASISSLQVSMLSSALDRDIWRITWTDISNLGSTKTSSTPSTTTTRTTDSTSWTKCPTTWPIKCTDQQAVTDRPLCTHTWTTTTTTFQTITWCTLPPTIAIERDWYVFNLSTIYTPSYSSLYANMINDHFWPGRIRFTFLWFRRSSYLLSSSSSRSLCCRSLFFLYSACCKLNSSVALSILKILWCFYVSSLVLCLEFSIVCWSNMKLVFLVLSLICCFSLICSSKYYFWSFWYSLVLSWWGWSSPSKNVNPELSWVCWRVGLGRK